MRRQRAETAAPTRPGPDMAVAPLAKNAYPTKKLGDCPNFRVNENGTVPFAGICRGDASIAA